MAHYAMPVHRFMSEPVHGLTPETTLAEANLTLHRLDVSCVAVVDGRGDLRGVVSRTDLLRVGRRRAGDVLRGPLLELGDGTVADVMTRDVLVVAADDPVAVAGEKMLTRGVHRVFVVDGRRVIGVLSTRDVMAAIVAERDDTTVGQHMSTPLFTVDAAAPLLRATELLDAANIGGVVVTENDWPVGMFTQVEALRSADVERSTPVEEVMELSFVCLPVDMRMHRAAAQALRLKARRVVAVARRDVAGILSGLDFARCAARPLA